MNKSQLQNIRFDCDLRHRTNQEITYSKCEAVALKKRENSLVELEEPGRE